MQGKKKIQVISFQSLSANTGAGMARLGYYLSAELNKRGLLKNFIVHSKGKYDTPFPSLPVTRLSRYYLHLLNTINNKFGIPNHKFRLVQEQLFDWFCSFRIKPGTSIIFSTNAFMKHSFKKAKRLGIIVVLLPGTPEENYIFDLVTEENKKLNNTGVDPYTYKKRLRYLNGALAHVDVVIGSLPTVYQAYANSKVFKGKVVKILGHMTPDFTPLDVVKNTVSGNYKVGYVAHTVILKGLHYLIEAWAGLMQDPANHNMALYIGGNIEKDVLDYINTHFAPFKNVEILGHVKDVSTFLQPLDLFIVPSLVDGGPITALEAAHLAVPVIITDNCGSSELLGRGDGGCITIPIRDAGAIKKSILWAYNNRSAATKIGFNGKKNMNEYSMKKFISEIADYLEHKI